MRGWKPGEIIAKRHGAICRAAVDGAVWISHLRRKNINKLPFYKRVLSRKHSPLDFKLPATMVLGEALNEVPESPIDPLYMGPEKTFKEIWYEEVNQVGYLHFDFHNGAMSTEQCQRLLELYRLALKRPTKVIVLMGGTDFWSNGIHLNIIEAADRPADESWRNINAIDDVVYEIINTNQPSDGIWIMGRRRCGWCHDAIGGGLRLGPRGLHHESSLQDDGTLWFRVLDLSLAEACRARPSVRVNGNTLTHRHEKSQSNRHDR